MDMRLFILMLDITTVWQGIEACPDIGHKVRLDAMVGKAHGSVDFPVEDVTHILEDKTPRRSAYGFPDPEVVTQHKIYVYLDSIGSMDSQLRLKKHLVDNCGWKRIKEKNQ